MKKSIYLSLILLSVVIFTGCNAAKNYLKQGNYNAATYAAAEKLQKKNTKEKMIEVLKQAYPKAVTVDNDRINYLNQEGKPDRWDEIYHIYENMNERQKAVELTYPLYLEGKEIKFAHVDYNTKIIHAKNMAADYFYYHAKDLMNQNTKQGYRQAFDEFLKAQNYTGKYPDVDGLMDTCYLKGTTNLILIAVNSSPFVFQNDFMINLIDFSVSQLNGFWHQYYTTDQLGGVYDVYVNVTLTMVDVSPNNKSVKEYSESKKIEDGWEYKTDGNGNVLTDSLGNKIKVTKYKTITCKIYETRQYKVAHLEGAINYVDGKTRQIVKSVPVAADHVFENYYSTASGDERALSNETKAKLKQKPAYYPSDIDMIYGANATLRDAIYDALRNNKSFVESYF